MSLLAGKVALVTGASRGIGKAIALELGRQGAAVIGTSTSAGGAEGISRELTAAGVAGGGILMDVGDAASVESAMEQAQQRFGDIAILVNNAGVTRDGLLMRMSEADWDTVLDTNLKGAFLVTKAFSRAMLKQRAGRIINVASVIGLIGNAGQSNYAASKAGLIGFTQSMARELGSRSITVNAIAPGFIETDMTADIKPEMKTEMLKQIPLGSLGQAEDVANAALFLASPAARYITGQVLTVDGGMVM
jgi:3-oxoacyl-[acyl-carrier protein] reductase